MMDEGFHIHHMDGDHENNDPMNLVLIEGGDHMMLHNGKTRLLFRKANRKAGPGRPKKVIETVDEVAAKLEQLIIRDGVIAEKARKAAKRANKARLEAEKDGLTHGGA